MPWNSPKRPQYWNFSSGFDFDHITAVDISFCTSLRNFIQIGPPSAKKQEAQLSQRDRTTLRVIEYFANSPKVTQVISNNTVE